MGHVHPPVVHHVLPAGVHAQSLRHGKGDKPQLLLLSACASLITSDEDLAALQAGVSSALDAGLTVADFRDFTVLLPDSAQETEAAMQHIARQWQKKTGTGEDAPQDAPVSQEAEEQEQEQEESVQLSVKIDLHDTCVEGDIGKDAEDAEEGAAGADRDLLYRGDLYTGNLRYTFKPYQEEGTRWLLGLMTELLQEPAQHQAGGAAPAGDGGSASADENAQKAGQEARKKTAGALLADDMGLGKTFMVLAALNVLLTEAKRQKRTCKPILVVMPVVLLENWREEIDRGFYKLPFACSVQPGDGRQPDAIVLLQAGADLGRFRREHMGRESVARSAEDMPSLEGGRYSLKVGREYGPCRLDLPGRIVLTNYDTLRDYQFSLSLVDWSCVILDEAQEIRNPNTLKSRAARRCARTSALP